MVGVTISNLPLELLARIFEAMDLEDAWTSAREVCRRWHDVFEFCAYSSNSIYLRRILIGVDIVCEIFSAKGEVLDRQVIHGELRFNSSKGNRTGNIARWTSSSNEACYQVWPGGRWRTFSISDVLTNISLRISNFSSNAPINVHVIQLGRDVTLVGSGNDIFYTKVIPHGDASPFSQFVVSVDTAEEPSFNCSGRSYRKHSITGFIAPTWKIYALLVHYSRINRAEREIIHRHYVQAPLFSGLIGLKEKQSREHHRGFEGSLFHGGGCF